MDRTDELRRVNCGDVNRRRLWHPDTAHLGALPYAFGTLGLSCKVYATLPVHKMGMMYMYDQYLARSADSDFDVFTLAGFVHVSPVYSLDVRCTST